MVNESAPQRPPAPPWQPLAFALILILGVFIGMSQNTGNEAPYSGSSERGRVVHILDRIERLYVDEIERDALESIAVEAILDELDPHSMFFSAEEAYITVNGVVVVSITQVLEHASIQG